MNWFSYNGVRSAERYIRISDKDIFSGPKYDSTVQSIPGRDGDLICPGGRLGNVSLSYTCFVPAKTVAELEERLTDVKAWLYTEPDRYHELFDSYDTRFFRRAVFNSKLDISEECRKIGVFTVSFSCYPLRFLRAGQEKLTFTESGFVLTNPFPFPAKPYLKVLGRGSGNLTVQSPSHNATWSFSTLDGYTECDSELMNFYHDTEAKNDTVSGDGFPLLYPGENTVSFDGKITGVEIIPRWATV